MRKLWRCSMEKRRPWLESVAIAACCLVAADCAVANATGGYLRSLGPAPVRYQPRHPAPSGSTVLPSLLSLETTGSNAVETVTNSAPPNIPSIAPTNHVAVPPADETVPAASPDGADLSDTFPPGPLMVPDATPQMINPDTILQYLAPVSTNATNQAVLVPVFVPPTPPPSTRSSHATYEVR